MSRDNAMRIGRVIAETYRYPWSPEAVATWVSLTEDLDDEASNRALREWLMREKKAPTPAEFREAVKPPVTPWDGPTFTERRVKELEAPRHVPTKSEMHQWRKEFGQPKTGCDCESCTEARRIGA